MAKIIPLSELKDGTYKTLNLRFVMRRGKKILQQQWQIGIKREWYDVPVEPEFEKGGRNGDKINP